jgi:lysophospholipase L1-like esterase
MTHHSLSRRQLFGAAGGATAFALLGRLSASAQQATPMASPVAMVRDWASEHWVGSWATSPAMPWPVMEGFPDTTIALDDQTLRQIVRLTLGGDQIRVRLSNTYGDAPFNIGDAQVALRDSESTTNAASTFPVTFAGNTSVSIPPGAMVLSDPIPLPVEPLQELAVSLYFPAPLEAATVHGFALQTNYISEPGDHAAASEFPVAGTTESTAFLTGIDVAATPESSAIVTLGDSITEGFGSTIGAYGTWPDALANRLVVAGLPRAVLNEGIGGNRLLSNPPADFGLAMGESALTRFDRDVLGQAGVEYLIVYEGINDIGMATGMGMFEPSQVPSSAELISALNQVIERAHERGIIVIGGTITPYEGAAYFSAEGEAIRQEVNAWIRTSGAFDHVVDFEAAVQDPSQPTRILAEYDPGDALHINDAGYAAMAEAINLDWFAN